MTQPAVRNRVRIQVTEGEKRRYWRPKDGMWTHPLGSNASMERFYTRMKGFMTMPPGELAVYVNVANRDNLDPDPRTRAETRARAHTGPLPTGSKERFPCHGHEGCDTWEAHYSRLGMEVDYMLADEPSEAVRSLTDDDVIAVVERLEKEGFRLVKNGNGADIQEQKADGGDLGKVQVEAGTKGEVLSGAKRS
jgi:hypothetical protein